MIITRQATDQVILAELGERLARMRLDQNLTRDQLAEQAGVSRSTIERLETGAVATQLSGFIRVCRVLNLIERFNTLIPEPAPSPIAQLKLQGKTRRRARAAKAVKTAGKTAGKKWKWGDEQ